MTRKWFQIHLSTAVVLVIMGSLFLAVFVGAWKDVKEFEIYAHWVSPLPSNPIAQRKQLAQNVLTFGPPIACFLLFVTGAALEWKIARETRKP